MDIFIKFFKITKFILDFTAIFPYNKSVIFYRGCFVIFIKNKRSLVDLYLSEQRKINNFIAESLAYSQVFHTSPRSSVG